MKTIEYAGVELPMQHVIQAEALGGMLPNDEVFYNQSDLLKLMPPLYPSQRAAVMLGLAEWEEERQLATM